MILRMSKIRIMGPRDMLPGTLRSLQQLGLLHLSAPATAGLTPLALSAREERERRFLRDALADAGAALTSLDARIPAPAWHAQAPDTHQLARWARLAGRVRRNSERLRARRAAG